MDKQNRTQNFRLSLVDDKTHRRIWVGHFTRGSLTLLVLSVLLILLSAGFFLAVYTPLRDLVPGREDASSRREALQQAMQLDSLEITILQWELYSENLKRVVRGEEPIRLDSLIRLGNARRSHTMTPEMLRADSLLRHLVREEEQFRIGGAVRQLPIEGMRFFTPLRATVTQAYERGRHPFLALSASERSVVKSILDGTVIYCGWEDEGGYSLAVQHADDLISVYRHCPDVMKKKGDRVTAGTAIGLTGAHPLELELWYRGDAVDPTLYINF